MTTTLDDSPTRPEPDSGRDRTWFDESPLPMWICDVETLGFLEVNDAAVEHYGYSRREFLAFKVFDLHQPRNGPAPDHTATLLTSRGFTCSMRRQNGGTVDLEVACSPIQYRDRAAFFAIVRDAEAHDDDGLPSAAVESYEIRDAVDMSPESPTAGRIGNWEWDIESGALTWSAEAYRMFEVVPGDRLPDLHQFMDRVVPEDRQRVRDTLDASLRTHQPFTIENRVRLASGSERVFYSSGVVMVNPAGRAVRMIGTVQDFTLMSPLRPARAFDGVLSFPLAEVAPVGMFYCDERGACRHVNATYTEMLGVTREQAMGGGWSQALHREDRERVVAEWNRAVEARQAFETEYRVERPDRSIIWVFAQAVPESSGSGRPAGYLGTITDITARRRAEQALDQERQRLQALFDHTQDAILLIDDAKHFVDANPAACAMLGYTRDEFPRLTVHDLTPSDARDQVEGKWSDLLERGKVQREFECVRKDGTRFPVEHNTVANVVPGIHFSVLRDISVRRRNEKLITDRERQQAMLADLGQQALAGMEAEALYEAAARRSSDALDASYARILELLPAGEEFVVRAEIGLTSESNGSASPAERPWPQARFTLAANGPVTIFDLTQETRFRPDPRWIEAGYRSGACVLIPGHDRPFGVLSILTRAIREFTQDDLNFLQSVASVIALAEMRHHEQEMRNRLLERVVNARDEERQRLARELHDETGQSLTALLVGLVTVEQAPTLEETRALAVRLRQITARTIEDLGRLARGLHPSVLTDLGLAEAARHHVRDFERSCGIPVQLRIRGLDGRRLRGRVEVTVYRALQEALTNVARHARATLVRVGLIRAPGEIVLVVKDDGIGFDVGAGLDPRHNRNGLGLHGMRERVSRAGGTMAIGSMPRAGTRLIVRIPSSPIRVVPKSNARERKTG